MTPRAVGRPVGGGPRPVDQAQRASLAVVQATWLLALVLLAGLAVVEVGAVLRAARVAGTAADGAALAAATATRPSSPITPRAAAARIARAHGAELVTCDCTAPPVTVEVVLPVTTRFLHHLGVTEARGTATARLVRQRVDDPPGAAAR